MTHALRARTRDRVGARALSRQSRGSVSRFIEPFLDWFTATTDAPYEYGQAAALYALSTIALSRRWVSSADHVHPNLFMMIVGGSSVARKSTAVKRSRAMVDEVEPNRIGPTDYTPEGIYRWMQGKDPSSGKSRTRMALFAGEFGADLARMEAYGPTTQADFCHLYDGEAIEKVRATKTIRIDRPRVNLFAAAAYTMLTRHLGPKDWYTGYLMRFLFVAPLRMRPENKSQPLPDQRRYDAAKVGLQVLRDDLVASPGGMQLTPGAARLYEQSMTYVRAQHALKTEIVDTYMARFWTNVLKLALLFQLDEDPQTGAIGFDATKKAVIFAMDVCWPSFQVAFEKTAARDFESLRAIVQQLGRAAGHQGLARHELAERFPFRELSDVVGWLKLNQVVSTRNVMLSGTKPDEVLVWRTAS